MNGQRERAIVIGGGIAGLSTAALLAREGYAVTVLEAREELGGRAGCWESGGFRFDTGPSWYLMPEVFEHFFRLLGTSAAAELDLVRLDPGYRVRFEGDPTPFDLPAGGGAAALAALDPASSDRLDRYLSSAAESYRLATERFLYSTYSSARPYLSREMLRSLPRLARLLSEPLDRFIARHADDPRVRQILGYPAVFLGTSPYAAPSLYHLMSHLDIGDGVYYPRGGFGTVIEAIARLAVAGGAEIRTGCRARAIAVADGAVRGVDYTDPAGTTHRIEAGIVVSTADLHHTETALLAPEHRSHGERWWARRNAGPGAVLALLGVRGRLPELAHHTLFFTRDWKAGFDAIYGPDPSVPNPASLYVCRPSATDAGVAPAGHENLFVLVPVPADTRIGAGGIGGTGDAAVEGVVDDAIDQIAGWAGIEGLADRIVVRRSIGPADFEREFGAWRGGALGPAHTLRQSAFLRGRNVSSRVRGLIYAGATTVPGVGLPMCLISAELVVKRLRGDTSSGPLAEPLAAKIGGGE